MAYTVRDKFAVYKVDPSTEESAHVWTNAELFKTSYYQQSVKNPLAMQNSTEQLNETKSKHLRSVHRVIRSIRRNLKEMISLIMIIIIYIELHIMICHQNNRNFLIHIIYHDMPGLFRG
jgi:hypothetical protein